MDKSMTKQESYAERRLLFKDIWETAMTNGDKDDIMNKPKVIKTLRIDDSSIAIRKKQRIKNLRNVCNKILDFCDRQDADDVFYEEMATEGQESLQPKPQMKPRKSKTHLGKRKFKTEKSLTSPPNEFRDRKKNVPVRNFKVSRNTSPLKRSIYLTGKSLKSKPIPESIQQYAVNSAQLQDGQAIMGHKTGRKKHIKIKKPLESVIQPGVLNWPDV